MAFSYSMTTADPMNGMVMNVGFPSVCGLKSRSRPIEILDNERFDIRRFFNRGEVILNCVSLVLTLVRGGIDIIVYIPQLVQKLHP